ncbi:MAG: MFS transporter [Spirochaetaceae bacterium]|jgi:fucose permease|nr:MFS transporter [Spirochaetaceae bacterium]
MARLLLIVIYLAFIGLGLPDSVLGSAWPSMYRSLQVPLHYAGYISMIIAGGTVVSSIGSAKIIGRLGTGMVTTLSVLMTAAALVGFSFSHRFIALCLCAVPLGLGAGSVDVALNNYVALHYKARHMSWLHCFWGIGASLGPMIMSAFLLQNHTWNSGYQTIGVIQVCLVLVLGLSLPLWKRTGVEPSSGKKSPLSFLRILRIRGVAPALLAFFCYCGIETVTGLWGSSYLVTVKHISPEIAVRWMAIYYMGITSGRFMSGFATLKLSNRCMIRLGQGLMALGIILLLLPWGNGTLLPGFFMIGLGCAPIYPSLLHETPKNFGEAHSQVIIGIQMASAYIGTTLMPPLFGRLASYLSFSLFPLFIGSLLTVKIIMVKTLNRSVDSP